MTLWQWLTIAPSLNNNRDLMARIGYRFLWCTAPYFIAISVLDSLGFGSVLNTPMTLFIFAIPLLGGLMDLCRLKKVSLTKTNLS